MKDIKTYINEAKKTTLKKEYPVKKKETYGELGEKWFDKCRNFATAGSTQWTKYGINDFKGFLEDMEKEFDPPKDSTIATNRWEMCKALKDGNLEEFIKIAKDKHIDKFTYGAYMSERVYGSYFLDTYMLLRTYEYILDGNLIIRNGILNAIWNIDDYDNWYDKFIPEVHKLEKQVPGHK